MTAAVWVLLAVAVVSWLAAVGCASRSAQLGLSWPPGAIGPIHTDTRAQHAARARIWALGLGGLATIAILGAVAVAVIAR